MKNLLILFALLLASIHAQAETITPGSVATFDLAPGQSLTVTTGAADAIIQRYNGPALIASASVDANTETAFGEYFIRQQFRITALTSPVTYEITQSTDTVRTGIAAITGGSLDAVAVTGSAITGATAFSLTEDVALLVSDGAPENATLATLDVDPTGDDNGLTFTAVAYGADGNAISIEYVDPDVEEVSPLSVSVVGSIITVTLETDEMGAIVTTAAEVLAAIEADAAADALVTVAIDAADSGDGDDGSGVVTEMAADLLEGGEGTGIGTAGTGSLAIDYTNAALYINAGTLAVPEWAEVAGE